MKLIIIALMITAIWRTLELDWKGANLLLWLSIIILNGLKDKE